MALEIRQVQKLVQQLVMTPQLQQAIKLLQLSRVELQEMVTKELQENPTLEEVAPNETADGEQYLQAESVLLLDRKAPETDARACRNNLDRLVGEFANDIGHQVVRITGVVLDPLPQDSGQTEIHSGDRGVTPETTDHGQPRRS